MVGSLGDFSLGKLGGEDLHNVSVLEAGLLALLVVLLHEGGEGVGGLGLGGGGCGGGRHLLPVHHQLEPADGRGVLKRKIWILVTDYRLQPVTDYRIGLYYDTGYRTIMDAIR